MLIGSSRSSRVNSQLLLLESILLRTRNIATVSCIQGMHPQSLPLEILRQDSVYGYKRVK